MTRQTQRHPLLRAIQPLLPQAQIRLLRQRDWYSMTFAGERIAFSIGLASDQAMTAFEQLARSLPEAQFDLPDLLVADIVVERVERAADGATLFGEALLLIA